MSPAYRFHPEFGYFCPTPRFRRKVWVGITCIIIGLFAGSAGTFVFKTAHDSKDGGRAMKLVQVDEPASAADVVTAAAERPVPAPAEEKPRPTEEAKAGCESGTSVDQTWAYLDGKCAPGRTRKTRVTRTPGEQGAAIAAIPIGRPVPPTTGQAEPAAAAASGPGRRQQSPAPVVQPAPATQPGPASAAESAIVNPPAAKPSEPAAAAPKKVQKTARRANTQRSAHAAPRDPRLHPGQPHGRVYAMPDPRAQQRGPVEGGLFGGGGAPFGFMFR